MASFGLHFYNMNLCHNFNDLVNSVRDLGIIDRCHFPKQNPSCKRLYVVFAIKEAMMFVAHFLIGNNYDVVVQMCVVHDQRH